MQLNKSIIIEQLYAITSGKVIDIVQFEVTRTVDAFPSCVVMFSSAALKDITIKLDSDIIIYADIRAENADKADSITLFNGYISSELLDVRGDSQRLQSYQAYRVSCKTEHLICVPPAAGCFVTNRMFGSNNEVQQGQAYLKDALDPKTLRTGIADSNTKDIGEIITRLVNNYKVAFDLGLAADLAKSDKGKESLVFLRQLVPYESIELTLKSTKLNDHIANLIRRCLSSGYNYYDVIHTVAKDLYLSMIPTQTPSGDVMKICYRPGWVKGEAEKNKITPSEYTRIRSSTASGASRKLDGVILDHAAQTPDAVSLSLSGYVTYPDNIMGNVTNDTNDANDANRIWKVQRSQFPSWLTIKDNILRAIEAPAKALAKTIFANYANSTNTVDIVTPLVVGLANVNNLGNLYTIVTPTNREYIGQLNSVRITLNVAEGGITTNSYLTFTKTVPKAEFETYQLDKTELLYRSLAVRSNRDGDPFRTAEDGGFNAPPPYTPTVNPFPDSGYNTPRPLSDEDNERLETAGNDNSNTQTPGLGNMRPPTIATPGIGSTLSDFRYGS